MMRCFLALVALSLSLPPACSEEAGSAAAVVGPFAELATSDSVRIAWQTEQPTRCLVHWGRADGAADEMQSKPSRDGTLQTEHEVLIPEVAPHTVYRYRIRAARPDGTEQVTPEYRFDTAFDYGIHTLPKVQNPFPEDPWTGRYQAVARRMLAGAGRAPPQQQQSDRAEAAAGRQGYCLVVGAGDGRLAYELARLSRMQIVVVEKDATRVRRARAALDQAGLYGTRVSVHHGDLESLAYGPYFANLIVSDSMLTGGAWPAAAPALIRLLRPCGGVLFLGRFSNDGQAPLSEQAARQWLGKAAATAAETRMIRAGGDFLVVRRAKLDGSSDWTHQYALPDNSACSRDQLVGGDLTVQWWGRPGARPMPDRGPRNPAPVAAGGYLFVEGYRVLFGMDAYNGTILWTLQIPTLRRANMPRDGSNMVTTGDLLYLAMGSFCVGLDPTSGRPVRRYRVAGSEAARDWGYLACVDDLLVGSAVKKGSQYLGDDGEWYEDFGDANVARVTSDRLFAMDRRDGTTRWSYDGGIVINSTITIANGCIWFVESTNPAAAAAASGRLYQEVQKDQRLVAIALDTGKLLWRTPFDFSQCQFMIYACYGADTVIIVGADQQKVFHTYAFSADQGKFLWQHEAAAQKHHHSGHLGHPVLVDGKLYGNRMVLDVATGKVLQQDLLERRGCGTMAGSSRALFYRHYYHGTWDLETNVRREYIGVRTNCWLGTIPAGGLLLLPESAAGCSCDGAVQTSMAMVPRAGAAAPQSRASGAAE